MEIDSNYHLGNNAADSGTITALNITLKTLSERDFNITIDGAYKGIDFIKGYKKEITPLLDSMVNVGVNGSVNLNQPVSNFTHFIIKTTYKNSKIEYSLMSLYDLKTYTTKCYVAYHDWEG
jgi:hypothetical protein